MFIDSYLKICEEFGVAPTKVLTDLGISKSAYTNWKNGGEPANRTKKQIADYFGISVAELMSGEIKKSPAKAEEDDELEAILQDFKDNPELRALFKLSRKATPDELRQYQKIIKALRGSGEE